MTYVDIDAALDAYIDAVLWAETDDSGETLDTNFDVTDFDSTAIDRMREIVVDFVTSATADRPKIFAPVVSGEHWQSPIFRVITGQNIGHDLYLTGQRHGAGFWDRGYGERGQWLTDRAHMYGVDVTVGDDGKIYVS